MAEASRFLNRTTLGFALFGIVAGAMAGVFLGNMLAGVLGGLLGGMVISFIVRSDPRGGADRPKDENTGG